jgi:large subunit ribosomal protein L15
VKVHDLKPAEGSKTKRRRVGRGIAGKGGKTAGRGTKGQKSRSGSSIPAWFEGGQTPLHVRTPKLHGFKNRFRVEYAGVNLGRLSEAAAGTLITPDVLVHDGLLRQSKTKGRPVKILGGGDAPKGVTIHAHAFTRSALEKLSAAGSTAQRISWPEGNPIDEDAEARDAAAAEADADAKAEMRAAKAEAKTEEREAVATAEPGDDEKAGSATDAAEAEASAREEEAGEAETSAREEEAGEAEADAQAPTDEVPETEDQS